MNTPVRAPIHLGSGEPILLLHPFLCSQNVWRTVADQLADTGRYEVFAPTMVGHNGGPRATSWFMDTADLVDDVERRMDELGWHDGAHRRQLARRLGGLRAGAPRTRPHADRDRTGGRLVAALAPVSTRRC